MSIKSILSLIFLFLSFVFLIVFLNIGGSDTNERNNATNDERFSRYEILFEDSSVLILGEPSTRHQSEFSDLFVHFLSDDKTFKVSSNNTLANFIKTGDGDIIHKHDINNYLIIENYHLFNDEERENGRFQIYSFGDGEMPVFFSSEFPLESYETKAGVRFETKETHHEYTQYPSYLRPYTIHNYFFYGDEMIKEDSERHDFYN